MLDSNPDGASLEPSSPKTDSHRLSSGLRASRMLSQFPGHFPVIYGESSRATGQLRPWALSLQDHVDKRDDSHESYSTEDLQGNT